MGAREKSRFTTAQAGWIALAIFGGWLGFIFLPVSWKPQPEAPPKLPAVDKESWLEDSPGLANNPDWTGLSDYFAVWANSLAWQDNRLTFAYWNPGSRSYTYFFEAIRIKDGYRFRALSRKEAARFEDLVDALTPGGKESETHPFVFWRTDEPTVVFVPGKVGMKIGTPPQPQPSVKVDLPVKPLPVPPPPPPKSSSH